MNIICQSILSKETLVNIKKLEETTKKAGYTALIANISACAFIILFPIAAFVRPDIFVTSLVGRFIIPIVASKLGILALLLLNIFASSTYFYFQTKYKAEIDQLRKLQSEKDKGNIAALEKTNESLKADMAALQEKANQVQQLQKQLGEIDQKRAELQAEIEKLPKVNAQDQAEKVNLRTNLEEASEKIAKFEQTMKDLAEEKKRQNQLITRLQEPIGAKPNLEGELKRLQAENRALEARLRESSEIGKQKAATGEQQRKLELKKSQTRGSVPELRQPLPSQAKSALAPTLTRTLTKGTNKDKIFEEFKTTGIFPRIGWRIICDELNGSLSAFIKQKEEVESILLKITKFTGQAHIIDRFGDYKKEDLIRIIDSLELVDSPKKLAALSEEEIISKKREDYKYAIGRFDHTLGYKLVADFIKRATDCDLESKDNSPQARELFIKLLKELCGPQGLKGINKEFFINSISKNLDLETLSILTEVYLEPYLSGEENLSNQETVLNTLIRLYRDLLHISASSAEKIPLLKAVAFQIKRFTDDNDFGPITETVATLFNNKKLDANDLRLCVGFALEYVGRNASQRTLFRQMSAAYTSGEFNKAAVPAEQTLSLSLEDKITS